MRSAKMALAVTFVATVATATVGHFQAQLMTEQQPMKMAAAEALYDTEEGAGFSLFAVAPFEATPDRLTYNLTVPKALSILSTNTPNGEVRGINDIQAEYQQRYGPGDYVPVVGVTYWSFRLMVGAGILMILLSAAGLILARRRRLEGAHWFHRIALWAIPLPFIANATGWIFTEMGRQPWAVQGLLRTDEASSPTVSAATVALSLAGFTVLYGVLAGVAGWLAVRELRKGPEPETSEDDGPGPPARPGDQGPLPPGDEGTEPRPSLAY
jgi:cytochrome d ubiquinol oxidase subunit I